MKLNSYLAAIGFAATTLLISCSQNGQEAQSNEAQSSANAVIENIMTRTSVRQYSSRAIAKDTLDILVKAGMAAPTAMNKQPWAFVIVNDRVVLDSLAAVHPYSHLENAAAAIIVCGDVQKAAPDTTHEFWIQDCSAASENILLAAHALGIGAVWCAVYPNPNIQPEVTRVLGLPEDIIPLNIITMGYPTGDQQPKDKFNPNNVHYQKW